MTKNKHETSTEQKHYKIIEDIKSVGSMHNVKVFDKSKKKNKDKKQDDNNDNNLVYIVYIGFTKNFYRCRITQNK